MQNILQMNLFDKIYKRKKASPYISIDIGNKNIKVVHGKASEDKIQIMQYGIADTPSNSINDGKIINPSSIANEIKNIISANGIKDKKIIFNIEGSSIITRDIQIPKSTDKEIEKMLEFEAQQYFPVNLASYIVDFKILEEIVTEEGLFNRVLLVAVPKKQVEDFIKLSEMLDLEIEAIDFSANCFLKFLYGDKYLSEGQIRGQDELPNEFVVLDMGYESTTICIFCNKKLMFNRSILSGSAEIDRHLSNAFNVDYKEAERYKIFKARVEDNAEKWDVDVNEYKINEIAKNSVDGLIGDLNRFFEFYSSRSAKNSIEKIFVCGGGSKLNGLDDYMSTYFQVPVEPMIFSIYDIEYTGSKPLEELNKDFVFLINAIGALVRD